MSGAQITISLQEFEAVKNKIKAFEAEITELRTGLEAARLGDSQDDRARLAAALDRALVVVQFALAERNPLAFRGFPYQALRELGVLLASCPGIPQTFRECAAGDFDIKASEYERWEKARAEGREQEMLAEENAARGIGPDHPLLSGRS